MGEMSASEEAKASEAPGSSQKSKRGKFHDEKNH